MINKERDEKKKKKHNHPWVDHYPEELDWDMDIPDKPVYAVFDEAMERYPDNICLDFLGKKYTYKTLNNLINRAAKGFQKIGVAKGTRVGLFMPNCPQYVISYYAILKIGGIVVNFNPLYVVKELQHQLEDSGVTIMVTLNLSILYAKVITLLQSTPLDKIVVSRFQKALPFPKNKLFCFLKKDEIAVIPYGRINVEYHKLLDNDGKYKPVEIAPKTDLAVIQYTGGTTGIPKGAMLTHDNLYKNAVQCGAFFTGLEEGKEKVLAVLPFFHVFAMTAVLNMSISKGLELILHPKFDLIDTLKDIHKKKPTILFGVPTIFTMINNHHEIEKYDLSSLKFAVSGGAALPSEVKQKFESISGAVVAEGYGLTECSPVVTVNPLFGLNKTGSIGIPLPKVVVEIVDRENNRKTMPIGEAGEVCISGPNVMKGYWTARSDIENPILYGRLHTGDIGYMDEDGYIYIIDRIKELIISGGVNIYPRNVENAIYQNRSVSEVAVIGVPEEYKGEVVMAVVVLRRGEELSPEKLHTFLEGKLAKYELPRYIEFRESLPKTTIGKIDKKALKEEILNRS